MRSALMAFAAAAVLSLAVPARAASQASTTPADSLARNAITMNVAALFAGLYSVEYARAATPMTTVGISVSVAGRTPFGERDASPVVAAGNTFADLKLRLHPNSRSFRGLSLVWSVGARVYRGPGEYPSEETVTSVRPTAGMGAEFAFGRGRRGDDVLIAGLGIRSLPGTRTRAWERRYFVVPVLNLSAGIAF